VTDAEARTLLVEALHQTARSFNNPAVSERLQNPAADLPLADLELDSLDLVEWGVEIEKRSGIALDTADLAGASNLSQVVRTLMARQTGND
jgi:acyl carrier protein